MIHIELYKALWNIKKQKGMLDPKATYIEITRTVNSPLAPSRALLDTAKAEKWAFPKYKSAFLAEKRGDMEFRREADRIAKLAFNRDVYLICYEKNPDVCHRSIVKTIIDDRIESWRMMYAKWLIGKDEGSFSEYLQSLGMDV